MRKTRDRPRIDEHDEQAQFMEWCDLNSGRWPELRWMFAVPNGARTTMTMAYKLKKEGMKAGVPDLCLPVPRGKYHGLWLEAKAMDGNPSDKQMEWLQFLNDQGYLAALAYGFDQLKETTEYYLQLNPLEVRDEESGRGDFQ